MNNIRATTSVWGRSPACTPFAKAIAAHYPIQIPWYSTQLVTLDHAAAPPPRVTQILPKHQHDVLILGASASVERLGADTINHKFVYLNITHQESGVGWATPNKLGAFPLPAFAGIGAFDGGGGATPIIFPTSIVRLPEAFFLPANTQLQIDWTVIQQFGVGVNDAILTLIGVQLINPMQGFRSPQKVTMPSGNEIKVDSRLPWFATVPIGEYQSRDIEDFEISPGDQVTQFFPPQDCDVEIHGIYSNFVNPVAIATSNLLTVKLTDMGVQTHWTPNLAQVTAVFGGEGEVEPAMPFTKPYLLRRGHRLQMTIQSNATGVLDLLSGTVTLRGVRRCEY